LNAGEVRALAALPPANYAPIVSAGEDITVQQITPAILAGQVEDDGRPDPPVTVTSLWLMVEGSGDVSFEDDTSAETVAHFSAVGTYVLRLIADDGQVKIFDEVTVTITDPTTVYVYATDSYAAELGPDEGLFTFYRSGDLGVDLPVYFTIGGSATPDADYTAVTNLAVIPADVDFVNISIVPMLDDRTEGEETVVLTVSTNQAYSIGSGDATVTIQDSPHGMWNIATFTLEELTDPTLTGDTADFDDDGMINFIEYAFNRNPKVADTGRFLTTSLEPDTSTGETHIHLTFQRRMPPTDVDYAVWASQDLWTWNTGEEHVEELEVTDDGNGLTETVRARLTTPLSTSVSQFISIRVWRAARP
jgi:hypothetical protein